MSVCEEECGCCCSLKIAEDTSIKVGVCLDEVKASCAKNHNGYASIVIYIRAQGRRGSIVEHRGFKSSS